jgi:hypothetical protein
MGLVASEAAVALREVPGKNRPDGPRIKWKTRIVAAPVVERVTQHGPLR